MGVAVLDNDVRAPVFEGGDRTAQGRAEDDEGHGQREVAERDRLASAVPEEIIDSYHRLFKSKNGMAVVGLVDEVCQGCHMKVVKSTMIEVKAENHLAHCENCGRILYWWTDERVGKNRGEY